MSEDWFGYCLKALNVPTDLSFDSLSYSEKALFTLCRKLDTGQYVDFSMLDNLLDDDQKKRVADLLSEIYNW